ncbi:lipoyl(octanoyl) transferase LipB [Buchnera aphidicola (Sarucallis kahawaluokalani)]|uniref:Octanoyltransferase n=2 Tax=Buchnera aphidicola TaxID=9 RepID=A0A4D6YI03_9GAMM|nr:lipoyl(octanoyl) transferase LipB [Buchnera aphidicola (Sarucallis kahawaluokalani)]
MNSSFSHPVIIRDFGICSWSYIFNNMNHFTNVRNQHTIDEIWFVEHYPVYTNGQIGNSEFRSSIHNIPVIPTNRGGKITYHGPGQQIVYLLFNLKRLKINIRRLLSFIEKIVLNTLYVFSIIGNNNINPGIYVENKKICSIGLRIKKYYCLHGFSLNIKMDLRPFKYIDPCGDKNIIMTHMYNIKKNISFHNVKNVLIKNCISFFNLTCVSIQDVY